MGELQKLKFPEKSRIYPFGPPYKDQVVSIDSLVAFLSHLKMLGNSHISLGVIINGELKAEAEFHAIKYTWESNEKFLKRIGLLDDQDRLSVLESLLEVIDPESLNDSRFEFAKKAIDNWTPFLK